MIKRVNGTKFICDELDPLTVEIAKSNGMVSREETFLIELDSSFKDVFKPVVVTVKVETMSNALEEHLNDAEKAVENYRELLRAVYPPTSDTDKIIEKGRWLIKSRDVNLRKCRCKG